MPKLNNDYFLEILQKLHESEDDREESLEKFMLAGKECVEVGINHFSKLDVGKVEIIRKQWTIYLNNPNYKPNASYSLQGYQEPHNLIYDFDDFVLIQAVSKVLPISGIDTIKLKSPNPNCFEFLNKLEKLDELAIKCKDEKKSKAILTSLSNLKSAKSLLLIIPNIDSYFVDSLHFDFVNLNAYNYVFEKKLNFVKPKQNVKSVVLIGDEEAKKAFVFEPKHFINYFKAFPNATFEFIIHHTVTEADTNCLNFFDNDFWQQISIAIKEHASVVLHYYNHEFINKSKLWKRILREPNIDCTTCPFDSPRAVNDDGKLSFLISYEFSKRGEYLAECWNPNIQYNIHPKDVSQFKPEDFIELQIMDPFKNSATVKYLKDMKFEHLFKFYGQKVGVNYLELRFLSDGRRIGSEDTPRQFEMEEDDIIEVFAAQYG